MKQFTNDNSFYCLNCGQKNFSLVRFNDKKREKHHRKKLYCYHCQKTVNNIECKDILEVEDFKTRWASGEFAEEARISIEECNA